MTEKIGPSNGKTPAEISRDFESAWRVDTYPKRSSLRLVEDIRRILKEQGKILEHFTHTGTLEEREWLDNIYLGLNHYTKYTTDFEAKYSLNRKN